MISTQYMDMDSNGHQGKITCRLCKTEIYNGVSAPGVDPERMEAALEHFEVAHDIGRIDILSDIEMAFQEGKARKF